MKDIDSDISMMGIIFAVLFLFMAFIGGSAMMGGRISDSCATKGTFEHSGVVFECKPVSIKVGDIEAPIPTKE